jgi:hypothetical protein
VDQRVVDLHSSPTHNDRSFHPLGRQAGIPVAEALVQASRRVVPDAVPEADAGMSSRRGLALGRGHQLRRDTAPAMSEGDEYIPHLGYPDLSAGPGDVRVADRLVAVPSDEVRLMSAEAMQRQAVADPLDVDVGQGADVDDATSRRRNVTAPPLSSISFRFPHFGLCTQEGQPSVHGQPSSIRAVSATQPSKALKPRSVIPTPPEWPS